MRARIVSKNMSDWLQPLRLRCMAVFLLDDHSRRIGGLISCKGSFQIIQRCNGDLVGQNKHYLLVRN